MAKAFSAFQYEPLLTPQSWQGDERRFSIRLTELLDDLHRTQGQISARLKALESQTPSAPEAPSEPAKPSLKLLDVYPVGSIVVTSENINPGETFGGIWELVDKLLTNKSYNASSGAISINTSNTASMGTTLISIDGNTMELYVTITPSIDLGDTSRELFTVKLEKIGVSAISAKRITGYADGGNGLVNAIVNTSGVVTSADVVTKTSGGTVTADSAIVFNATWKIAPGSRLSAFCDRFFWKRTA